MQFASILLPATLSLSIIRMASAKIGKEVLLQLTNECMAESIGRAKDFLTDIAKQLQPGAGPDVKLEESKAKILKALGLAPTAANNPGDKSQPQSTKRTWTKKELDRFKAQKTLFEAYIDSIDRNFDVKCGFMGYDLDDVKKEIKRRFFSYSFVTSATEELGEEDKEVKEVLKLMPNTSPIKTVLECVRMRIENKVTPADAKGFIETFGNIDATDAENEILLSALRSVRCNLRFDPKSEDILGDMKKALPSLLWARLKKLYASILVWVECLVDMKEAQEFEWSDVWGCNGNWDIWNGQKCLARVTAKEKELKEAEEKKNVEKNKNDAAPQIGELVLGDSFLKMVQEASTGSPAGTEKETQAKGPQAAQRQLDASAKAQAPGGKMKQLWRLFYNRVVCRWSRAQDLEDKQAKAGKKPGSRIRRNLAPKYCWMGLLAWLILTAQLTILGFLHTLFGIEAGAVAALAGFAVGASSGFILFVGTCVIPKAPDSR